MAKNTNDPDEIDQDVRAWIYNESMQNGYPPSIAQVAGGLNLSVESVRTSFDRLAAGRVIVLQPESGEILMANPFSAVPTPFLVEVDGLRCYGNCAWDVLGIPAMLKKDARIISSCGDCASTYELQVVNGRIMGDAGVLHFAVPVKQWWQDIVFT